mgnify:CR=1 FL=1
MKSLKLITLGFALVGMMLSSAQSTDATAANTPEQRQVMAELVEASTQAVDQGAKFAAAADYLKLALVLGLGMLIGRMSAISHRELTEVKATLARLASSKSQLNPTADP